MTESMRAVLIERYGDRLRAASRPVPRAGPGDALVRVRASGLCSTDLHLVAGRQPLGELPRVVGHEIAGDVVALGEGVSGWGTGDRVTVAIDVTCGRCRHCLTGQTQRCRTMTRIGFERDGGHADYVVVPAANLVAIGDAMPYEAAAILPDAVACMYHSLIAQGGVGVGQSVLILGAGGLGIHGVQIARAAGARVMATSRRRARLELAERFGAVPVDPGGGSLAAAVDAFTDGEGVDVVVDNVGNRASVHEGLSLLRPGGRFLVVAYLDETFEVPSMRLFRTEQQIVGCRGSTKQDLIDVVRLVREDAIVPVLGASYPIGRIDDAVEQLESGDVQGRIWLSRE
jgi:D-arabinose 1-dehydrogenase-like Zn-dependent alcohol dehydrogenase